GLHFVQLRGALAGVNKQFEYSSLGHRGPTLSLASRVDAADTGADQIMNEILDIKTLAATTSWGRGRVYDNVTETIGHTPLVALNRLQAEDKTGARILLKLEF